MARYLTVNTCHTGCKRRPKYLHPQGVVIDLPEGHNRTKTWLSQRRIKQVPDETPLTSPKDYKAKMVQLMKGKRR